MDSNRSQLLPMRYKLFFLEAKLICNVLNQFEIGCFQKEKRIFELCSFRSSLSTCHGISFLIGLISALIKWRLISLVQILSDFIFAIKR